jgi:hypothetical protein
MRIWTLHPKYLDARRLVAVWREGLLAQQVLRGKTRGYRHHPQLQRFKQQADPVAAIATYLDAVYEEASRRGYRFDPSKIEPHQGVERIPATSGQLLYEWEHLKQKLSGRDPAKYQQLLQVSEPEPHPLFAIVAGEVEAGEAMRS